MIKVGDWVKIKDMELGFFMETRIPGPYKVLEKEGRGLCVSLMLHGEEKSDYPFFQIKSLFELVIPPSSDFWEVSDD